MSTETLPPTADARPVPQMKKWPVLLGGVGLAVIVVAVLFKPQGEQHSTAAVVPERGTPYLDGEFIRFSKQFAEREKLAFSVAKQEVLTPAVQVTGAVTYDARRVAAIGARIGGRVRSLSKIEGEDVKSGEVMIELESVELGKAQAEVMKVRAREKVAKLDEERERRLADAKVSPERDAQFARANAEALTAERVAAEKGVEALGGTVEGELGILRLRSPITGRIVESKVKRGETVESSDTLFVVADLSKVWVELAVYERDLPAVREDDEVEVRIPSAGLEPITGRIAHISELIDPESRSAHVRVEVDNAEGQLRPGLSVVGVIFATGPRQSMLVVPRGAVTRVDGKPTVFLQVSEGVVEPRSVELGAEDVDSVAVTRGLKAGDTVVAGGVLALKAEVFR
ncbi:MAG: efflux RND transporter periplasmic adaptor subunit [Myxococcales bacterium]|nr:efflux RND transporter periplasmic adaptor subunit [Myxococcales bacterium]MDP3505184.1 efflux RND transporter periplasmic adaptor subunit [Myxococcales bacterium]